MILENITEFLDLVPVSGKFMALDIGQKRIGLATSDEAQSIAFPKEVYERTTIRQDTGYLKRMATEQKIVGMVIGLPLTLDNNQAENCEKVKGFAHKLYQKTSLPIVLVDERFSTAAVTRAMKEDDIKRKTRHEKDDMLAATYILQTVLDSARQRVK